MNHLQNYKYIQHENNILNLSDGPSWKAISTSRHCQMNTVHDRIAGRYQKLINSIYCLSSFHNMNKYCLCIKSAKFCLHHMI